MMKYFKNILKTLVLLGLSFPIGLFAQSYTMDWDDLSFPDQVAVISSNEVISFNLDFTDEPVGFDLSTDLIWQHQDRTPSPVPSPLGINFQGNYQNADDATTTLNVQYSVNSATGALSILLSPNEVAADDIAGDYHFRINLSLDNGTTFKPIEYRVNVRKPLQMVFAVDNSGSMTWGPNLANTTTTHDNRWQRVKEGIHDFMQKVESSSLKIPQDEFSIVYFGGSFYGIDPIVDPDASFINLPGGVEFINLNNFRGDASTNGVDGVYGDMKTNPRQDPSEPNGGFDPADPVPRLAGGGTSIGAGLREAISNRFDATVTDTRKIIVLFTDGEQNSRPWIESDAGELYIDIFDDTGSEITATEGDPSPTLDPNDISLTGATAPFEFYTFGIEGMPPPGRSLLHLLGTDAMGDPNYFHVDYNTTEMVGVIAQTAFDEIYSESSPNTVQRFVRENTSQGRVTTEVNAGVSNLLFDLYFDLPEARNYGIAISKVTNEDTIDVSRSVTMRSNGDYFISASINFQNLAPEDTLDSEGTWIISYQRRNMILSNAAILLPEFSKSKLIAIQDSYKKPSFGQAALSAWIKRFLENLFANGGTKDPISEIVIRPDTLPKIRINVTADDHNLDFDTRLLGGEVKVGDRIKPSIRLEVNGQPVDNAIAKALVLRPGEDLGDILAETPNFPLDTTRSVLIGGYAPQKMLFLAQNQSEKLLEWRTRRGNEVDLIFNSSTGLYEGDFGKADISGDHQVFYFIEADHPEIGKIIRSKIETPFVRVQDVFTPGDLTNVVYTTGSDGTLFATATITPKYRSGNKDLSLGPGYDHLFSTSGDISVRDVIDNGDGSYTLTYGVPGGKKNPKVDIFVLDEPIHEGPLDFLSDPYRWGISLHAGATVPQGDMSNNFEGSYYVEGDLSYRLTPSWMLEAIGGFYNFDATDVSGAALLVKYNLGKNSQNWDLWLGGGPGFYQPDGGDLDLGWRGQVSGMRRLSRRLSLGVEVGYLYHSDPIQFVTGGLGLKIHF